MAWGGWARDQSSHRHGPGWRGQSEAWAQAGMVNTVKLLLIAQQSGLEVVEQEGHRTPLRPDDSPRPLIHRSLSELGLCPWLLGMSPEEIFLCGLAGSSVVFRHHWAGKRENYPGNKLLRATGPGVTALVRGLPCQIRPLPSPFSSQGVGVGWTWASLAGAGPKP